MGLDVVFYRQSKLDPRYREEVWYFRKVNFLLTYFGIDDLLNCNTVIVTKEMLSNLITDTNAELIHRNLDVNNKEPLNEKLKTKEVFFGGNIDYDDNYWNNIEMVRDWASKVIKEIDWDKDNLEMFISW